MNTLKILTILLLTLMLSCNQGKTGAPASDYMAGPIALHPENPHYFQYRGKTLALVTSAEHYGSVLNLDFDYTKYLETLADEGMNYTRIFTGVYFEIYGESFGIQKNTLAPKKGRLITPWETIPVDGKLKYDLDKWNEAYFVRLKDFLTLAQEKDIIVEVTLFSSIYREEHWELSPLNPENNANVDSAVSRFDVQSGTDHPIFPFQEKFVRKMVTELNPFDNFFFEIQNEPWADHPVPVYNIVNKEQLNTNDWQYKADFSSAGAMQWQAKIASIITDAENHLPKKHLIAQNYVNFKASIPEVRENISIINFHYAWPEAVKWNYHFNRVIGFDESGFAGSEDKVYRRQAWKFMLSGGGLFNNLDYSFFPGSETGTGQNTAPGGGSPELRRQLKILADFLHSFELEKMHPDCNSVVSAPGLIPYCISDPGNAYAIYFRATGTTGSEVKIQTGSGTFSVEHLDPVSGISSNQQTITAREGIVSLSIQLPSGELAVKLEAK